MAEKQSGQKTEKPTPRRIREGRRRGQIARSVDLVGWFALLLASFVLPPTLGMVHSRMRDYFSAITDDLAAGEFTVAMGEAGGLARSVAFILVPFLLFMAVVTAGGLVVQGGVTVTAEPLKPKLERISPKAGFKRLISAQSVVETGKALFRMVVFVVLVLEVMLGQIGRYLSGTSRSLGPTGIEIGASLLLLVRLAALVGLVVGFGDYAFQRYKIGKQLKMTKDEVKRENRNTEGDPLIKGRRRSMHAKVSQNQMLAAVGEASVVVVNPTHVAVALSYQAGGVPTVVAKGGDGLAAKIRERAFDSGVPVVEVRPLARILHDMTEVGDEVPAHLYEAVAIVIAFVMRAPKAPIERLVRRVSVPSSKLVDSGAGRTEA